ncbi:MAG TPA: hypothetical protein VD905_21955, partial [Flavobacteriales bacterium]|nr:hypothetical protein [Flavobacteriales bacterium]
MLTTNCFPQIGLIKNTIPDKDERRAKQLEKSPARDQIKMVEEELKDLAYKVNESKWDERKDERFMATQKDYDAIDQRVKAVEEAIAV